MVDRHEDDESENTVSRASSIVAVAHFLKTWILIL